MTRRHIIRRITSLFRKHICFSARNSSRALAKNTGLMLTNKFACDIMDDSYGIDLNMWDSCKIHVHKIPPNVSRCLSDMHPVAYETLVTTRFDRNNIETAHLSGNYFINERTGEWTCEFKYRSCTWHCFYCELLNAAISVETWFDFVLRNVSSATANIPVQRRCELIQSFHELYLSNLGAHIKPAK